MIEKIKGEIWETIKDHNGIYKISNLGRVSSYIKKLGIDSLLLLSLDGCGYECVSLRVEKNKYKSYRVHRLVALHFIPNIENKTQVNHINGIKTDNKVGNLEWCTPSENMKHAFKNNLVKNPIVTNLIDNDIYDICEKRKNGATYSSIGKHYNITAASVSNIVRGKTWQKIFKQ